MGTLVKEGCSVFVFLFMFLSIYPICYFILFRDRRPAIRIKYSSCMISSVHAISVSILGAIAIFSDINLGFAANNTAFQKITLYCSIAYFIANLLHYVVFFPKAARFVAPQLASLFVVFTCRHVVSHGTFYVFFLLVFSAG